MCGIAGLVHRDGSPADLPLVERMTAALAHRGPDDAGVWRDGSAALGHRRLTILDLSPRGRQPMTDRSGQVCLTYNGEIYNFQVLRRELEGYGHTFRSTSDTEVLLAAYLQWGKSCIKHLTGMFAFAVWDGRTRELFLARDPLGIKPLFYAVTQRCLAFGSEVKAVLASQAVAPAVDPDGFLDVLAFSAVIAPRTMFAGIRQLPAGHAATLDRSGFYVWRYWRPLDRRAAPRSEPEWIAGLVNG